MRWLDRGCWQSKTAPHLWLLGITVDESEVFMALHSSAPDKGPENGYTKADTRLMNQNS